MTTGGGSGFGQGGGAPSVTTLAPRLAGVRVALAGNRPRQALGAALVLLWALWLVALWVTQPRLVPADRFDTDLAQGRITQYALVTVHEERSGLFEGEPGPQVWSAPDTSLDELLESDVDEWSSSGARLTVGYWVDSPVAGFRLIDPDRIFPDQLRTPVKRLEAAGLERRTTSYSHEPVTDNGGNRYPLLMILALVVVVVGPRPGRGNRWFWFWLLGLPFGLGLLAFAVLELLRPPPVQEVPDSPAPPMDEPLKSATSASLGATASAQSVQPRRWTGWAGFGFNLVASIVLVLVADLLADLAPLLIVRA